MVGEAIVKLLLLAARCAALSESLLWFEGDFFFDDVELKESSELLAEQRAVVAFLEASEASFFKDDPLAELFFVVLRSFVSRWLARSPSVEGAFS